MAYSAGVQDIVDRWRALDDDEEAVAPMLLADAGLILDTVRPTVAGRVAAGELNEQLVTIALVRCVKRVLRNIDEVKSQQIGADGAVAVTFLSSSTGTAIRDGLYFLPDDLADIDRALANLGSASGRRTGSVRLSAYDQYRPDLSILPRA